jgi:hypothetical protein
MNWLLVVTAKTVHTDAYIRTPPLSMVLNTGQCPRDGSGKRMASSPQLAGITRVLDLIAAPLALEVLDGLGRGRALSEISPPGTPPETLHERD